MLVNRQKLAEKFGKARKRVYIYQSNWIKTKKVQKTTLFCERGDLFWNLRIKAAFAGLAREKCESAGLRKLGRGAEQNAQRIRAHLRRTARRRKNRTAGDGCIARCAAKSNNREDKPITSAGKQRPVRPEPYPDRLRQRLPASGSVHRWICRSPYG